MSILDEIFAYKREEVTAQKRAVPPAEVKARAADAPPARDFVAALRNSPARPALIAEAKKASPSKGVMAPDFDSIALAHIYREAGAAAMSVLTDQRYFQGHLDYLRRIAALPERLPLLRKDFIFDPYQVYEARAAGADAILLIVACLDPAQLRHLHALARDLGMAPLVEVHTTAEAETALPCDPILAGINNRDLHTFTVSLETTERLRPLFPPDTCVVAESGIKTGGDAARLAAAGADAMLVGESLVTADNTVEKIRTLLNGE